MSSILHAGNTLNQGEFLKSPNGNYKALFTVGYMICNGYIDNAFMVHLIYMALFIEKSVMFYNYLRT